MRTGNETKEKPGKLEWDHIRQRRYRLVNEIFGVVVPFVSGALKL